MQGLIKGPRDRTGMVHRRGRKRVATMHEAAWPPVIVEGKILSQDRGGLDDLAHDARNLLSTLQVCSELLAAPGVLSAEYSHYAQELQGVAATGTQLIEKLVWASQAKPAVSEARSVLEPEKPDDLGLELRGLTPLLTAIAGSRVSLTIECMPCAGSTHLSRENLTRILINLVRNAAEAMGGVGKIRVTAQYGDGLSFLESKSGGERAMQRCQPTVVIAVQDNGPGIPESIRGQIYTRGFTTRKRPDVRGKGRDIRGQGLSIVRSLVEAAGGAVRVVSRKGRGARLELEVPVTYGMCEQRTDTDWWLTPLLKGA